MQAAPRYTRSTALSFLLLSAAPALAELPERTRVGALASDVISLITENNPVRDVRA